MCDAAESDDSDPDDSDPVDWSLLQRRFAQVQTAEAEARVQQMRQTATNWKDGRCEQRVLITLQDWVRKLSVHPGPVPLRHAFRRCGAVGPRERHTATAVARSSARRRLRGHLGRLRRRAHHQRRRLGWGLPAVVEAHHLALTAAALAAAAPVRPASRRSERRALARRRRRVLLPGRCVPVLGAPAWPGCRSSLAWPPGADLGHGLLAWPPSWLAS